MTNEEAYEGETNIKSISRPTEFSQLIMKSNTDEYERSE